MSWAPGARPSAEARARRPGRWRSAANGCRDRSPRGYRPRPEGWRGRRRPPMVLRLAGHRAREGSGRDERDDVLAEICLEPRSPLNRRRTRETPLSPGAWRPAVTTVGGSPFGWTDETSPISETSRMPLGHRRSRETTPATAACTRVRADLQQNQALPHRRSTWPRTSGTRLRLAHSARPTIGEPRGGTLWGSHRRTLYACRHTEGGRRTLRAANIGGQLNDRSPPGDSSDTGPYSVDALIEMFTLTEVVMTFASTLCHFVFSRWKSQVGTCSTSR